MIIALFLPKKSPLAYKNMHFPTIQEYAQVLHQGNIHTSSSVDSTQFTPVIFYCSFRAQGGKIHHRVIEAKILLILIRCFSNSTISYIYGG